MRTAALLSCFLLLAGSALQAAPKSIRVFVALCDNDAQGIQPVNARIGNGNQPDANLYWGCSDGLASYFKRSKRWKLTRTEKNLTKDVMVRLHFQHTAADLTLTADAYRGTAIRDCTAAFEKAVVQGDHQLVAYLGHNGLMDFSLQPPAGRAKKRPDAVVLCCRSDAYFHRRLTGLGARPVLLTDQLMYPGAFLLHDAIEAWRQGQGLSEIRAAAGRAYARNQKIPVRAATGIFTDLEKKNAKQN